MGAQEFLDKLNNTISNARSFTQEVTKFAEKLEENSDGFSNSLGQADNLFSDSDNKLHKINQEEQRTVKLGKQAIRSPKGKAIQEFEAELDQEADQILAVEQEEGKGLKVLRSAEDQLATEIGKFEKQQQRTEQSIQELNEVIGIANNGTLTLEVIELIFAWMRIVSISLTTELLSLNIIAMRVHNLEQLNGEAITDLEETEQVIEEEKVLDQESEELAKETESKSIASQTQEEERKLQNEIGMVVNELEFEEENLKKLSQEIAELERSVAEIQGEIEELQDEFGKVNQFYANMARDLNNTNTGDIDAFRDDIKTNISESNEEMNEVRNNLGSIKDIISSEMQELESAEHETQNM